MIESWHLTLEWELLSPETFATRAEARAAFATWVDDYNHARRHSALGMTLPVIGRRSDGYTAANRERNEQISGLAG